MSETRIYRAITLRKALEQIKRELGEEALILGHKRVRAGGFLGIGARELVEVHVIDDPVSGKAKEPPPAEKSEIERPVKPSPAAQAQKKPAPTFASLATRVYSESSGNRVTPVQRIAPLETPRAPQPKPDVTPSPVIDPIPVATTETPSARGGAVASELNRLRSEFRELKFSLDLLRQPGLQTRTQEAALDFETSPEIYDTPYYESYMELLQRGLAPELARQVVQILIKSGDKNLTVEAALCELLHSTLRFTGDQLNLNTDAIEAKAATVFIGPTGVGKTTTIAKLAAHLVLRKRQRVELITLDTYRIAAPEQLKRYAEVIGAGCHVARSVIELDALTRRFAGLATVFVDTAGRSPHDLADQMELADYLRGARDLVKCLVLQATTHPADALIAARKFALYGCDQLVITKLDETTRPGAVVSTATDAKLPLAHICAGQRVPEDIERATPATLAARILRATLLAAAA